MKIKKIICGVLFVSLLATLFIPFITLKSYSDDLEENNNTSQIDDTSNDEDEKPKRGSEYRPYTLEGANILSKHLYRGEYIWIKFTATRPKKHYFVFDIQEPCNFIVEQFDNPVEGYYTGGCKACYETQFTEPRYASCGGVEYLDTYFSYIYFSLDLKIGDVVYFRIHKDYFLDDSWFKSIAFLLVDYHERDFVLELDKFTHNKVYYFDKSKNCEFVNCK